jgi:hypothetical protein
LRVRIERRRDKEKHEKAREATRDGVAMSGWPEG